MFLHCMVCHTFGENNVVLLPYKSKTGIMPKIFSQQLIIESLMIFIIVKLYIMLYYIYSSSFQSPPSVGMTFWTTLNKKKKILLKHFSFSGYLLQSKFFVRKFKVAFVFNLSRCWFVKWLFVNKLNNWDFYDQPSDKPNVLYNRKWNL